MKRFSSPILESYGSLLRLWSLKDHVSLLLIRSESTKSQKMKDLKRMLKFLWEKIEEKEYYLLKKRIFFKAKDILITRHSRGSFLIPKCSGVLSYPQMFWGVLSYPQMFWDFLSYPQMFWGGGSFLIPKCSGGHLTMCV